MITLQTVANYLLGLYGNNIGLDTESAKLIPDSQVPSREVGAKWAWVAWVSYISFIFSLKAVLLCLYRKIGYVSHCSRSSHMPPMERLRLTDRLQPWDMATGQTGQGHSYLHWMRLGWLHSDPHLYLFACEQKLANQTVPRK